MAEVNVRIRIFGRVTLHVANNPVKLFAGEMWLPWQLFLLLAMQRNRHLCDGDLIEQLWGQPESKDTKNDLKNLVLRLKRELFALADFEAEPIFRHEGGYRLSDVFALDVDYLDFMELCGELSRDRGNGGEHLFAVYDKIFKLYRGDIASRLEAGWVKAVSMNAAAQFLEVAGGYCEMLWNRRMYQRILDVYGQVKKVRRPCDELTVYRFLAMSKLGMHRGITSLFPKVAADFVDRKELESPVFREIREIAMDAQKALRYQGRLATNACTQFVQ